MQQVYRKKSLKDLLENENFLSEYFLNLNLFIFSLSVLAFRVSFSGLRLPDIVSGYLDLGTGSLAATLKCISRAITFSFDSHNVCLNEIVTIIFTGFID